MAHLSLPGYRAVSCVVGLCLIIVAGLCVVSSADTEGREASVYWVAPTAKAQKPNPIKAEAASVAAGRKVYMHRCAKCHGETGEGDGPDAVELRLHPAKFASSAINGESDGALYWKISVGKAGMPDFGNRLSPKERWNVINYLRTLGRH